MMRLLPLLALLAPLVFAGRAPESAVNMATALQARLGVPILVGVAGEDAQSTAEALAAELGDEAYSVQVVYAPLDPASAFDRLLQSQPVACGVFILAAGKGHFTVSQRGLCQGGEHIPALPPPDVETAPLAVEAPSPPRVEAPVTQQEATAPAAATQPAEALRQPVCGPRLEGERFLYVRPVQLDLSRNAGLSLDAGPAFDLRCGKHFGLGGRLYANTVMGAGGDVAGRAYFHGYERAFFLEAAQGFLGNSAGLTSHTTFQLGGRWTLPADGWHLAPMAELGAFADIAATRLDGWPEVNTAARLGLRLALGFGV